MFIGTTDCISGVLVNFVTDLMRDELTTRLENDSDTFDQ